MGLLLALTLGAGALSNFPQNTGGSILQPVVGLSLPTGPAVVAVAGEMVVAYRSDGTQAPGFPWSLGPEEASSGPPAAAEMDGDKDKRVTLAVATASGKLWLWSGGAPVPGFPVKLGAHAKAGPSFADVDGDGKLEVLVGDVAGRVHAFKKNGREAHGWPASVGSPVTSSVSSSRFAGGVSLAVGCEDGKVHVLDGATGRERPGFPLATAFAVTGAPAFADLDGDGRIDLVAASQDYKVYAVSEKGRPLPGFPVAAGYRIYGGPAIGDLTGDSKLDVVFTSADGFVHAVDGAGTPLPGFPVKVSNRFFAGPALGDVDRDGKVDIAVAAADGQVTVLDGGGKPLSGFPARFDATDLSATPQLFDLQADGSLSLFLGLSSGELLALRAQRLGSASPAATAWSGAAHDSARTGRFGPNPPRYRALSLAPARPRVTDKLVPSWQIVSLDAVPGQPDPPVQIDWLKNGQAMPELRNKRELPAGAARKGERWGFLLTPHIGPHVARSEEVTVIDSPPGPAVAKIEPAHPSRGGQARAVVVRPSADADGDAIRYRYDWVLDGVPTGVTGEVFPGEKMRRGALLAVRVTPNDGEVDGEPSMADARVEDTAPAAPAAVALALKAPKRDEVLASQVTQPATDLDGDPLVYHYRWTVAGQLQNWPLSVAALPVNVAHKHQKITLDVRAFDGQLEGPATVVEAEVANSPPLAPRVEIVPYAPRKGDTLRAVLLAAAPDADGDPLTYRFVWTKNGKPYATGGDPWIVQGKDVERGDRFEVTVSANDGEEDGAKTQAAVSTVNTPPTPPQIAIEPAAPHGGEPLKLVILHESQDADGDPIHYQVSWTHDGRAIELDGTTLPPNEFKKHEKVRVRVVPHDGREAGPAVEAEVVVADAIPTAPEVELLPERPVAGKSLSTLIRKPATDADGDRIRYRYRWVKDGTPIAVPDAPAEMLSEPGWSISSEIPAVELRKGQRWTVEAQAFDGEAYGPVVRVEKVVGNTPPPAPHLAFVPAVPTRTQGLAVDVKQLPDVDGDPITHRYAWFRDGTRVTLPPEQDSLPRGMAHKGERWAVEVVASDGEEDSPPARIEAVVANSPPGPAVVALCDKPVAAGAALKLEVRQAAVDPDGDSVAYRYAWTVDGRPSPLVKPEPGFPAGVIRKHQTARVIVTPNDGLADGPPVAAECVAIDTPPTAPEIAIEPKEPTAMTGLAVVIRKPSTDHDGDAVVYRYAWFRDNLATGMTQATVGPEVAHHREVWRVVVTPFDGEQEGTPVSAMVTIGNTAPPAPLVDLQPQIALANQVLSCQAKVPPRDVDEEKLELRYRWLRNGAPAAVGDGKADLPANIVRKNERWRCEAWAFDGFADGPRTAAEVLVRNSPPAAPKIAIEPDRPRIDDTLTCRVAEEAFDRDGDHVSYRYAWWKNGAVITPGPDPTRYTAGPLRKGERWHCAVTPDDGVDQGPPGQADRTVGNSPPGPARVRIVPASPKVGQALRCEVFEKAVDPNGDPVRYRYGWVRNGEPQPFAETADEVPLRLVKSGDRWRCQVVPSDGDLSGPVCASGEVVVGAADVADGPNGAQTESARTAR